MIHYTLRISIATGSQRGGSAHRDEPLVPAAFKSEAGATVMIADDASIAIRGKRVKRVDGVEGHSSLMRQPTVLYKTDDFS